MLLALWAFISIPICANAQENNSQTTEKGSQSKESKKGTTSFLNAEVTYSAQDSMSFDFASKKMYLFGKAQIVYGDITLTAHQIVLDMDSTLAYACGRRDSTGQEIDLPVFKDKSGEYEMREMKYNFKTKKAIITHIVTEQGEGYVVGNRAKRVDEKTYYMRDAKYTTCSNHEHPHFYLNLTKAKVTPGKKTVTGPAYLVLEDVPMPIAIPFAIIPNTKSYSSGIIMPTYGDESSRGFYLRNGGYYLALNDYFDMRVLADIYTKGSWGTHISSTYKKRYKFSGSFSGDYIVNKTSEKELPDYRETKDFSVRWNHSQDSKANPDQSFSASVNFSTSSYNKNNVTSVVNPETLATNQKSSSISYSRKWSWNPFRLQASLLHSQNSRDESVSLTLPDISITSSKRFYPFKPKKMVGSKSNPLYDINLSYSVKGKNSISCKESELTFRPEDFATAWKNGVTHSLPVSTNIKMMKYFTMTPSFNYTERWYFNRTEQYFDAKENKVVKREPTKGFYRAYDYSFSTGLSTKVYLFYTPWRFLFGDKINTIRHVMTPSVSFSYTPDFSQHKFGSYDSFEYYDKKNNEVVKYKYSYFNGYQYGAPGSAQSGRISLSLGNTLEMKVKSEKDTTGFAKISLLESLSFSSGYDLMKDSIKWDNISMSGRTKVFGTSVSFSANFDPYALVPNKSGSPIKINRSALKEYGKPARLTSASLSFGFQLSPEKFKKLREGKNTSDDVEDENEDWALDAAKSDNEAAGAQIDPKNEKKEETSSDNDGYAEFSMPWSISINYSLRVSQNKFNPNTCLYSHKVSQSVNVSGNISLTPKWKISISSGYSFDEKKLSQTSLGVTRDLHCWSMNFNIVPVGLYKSYNFNIAISSSILKDLKYQQSNSPRDNGRYR
ncbi:MAG: LPS-assembly protein LptD [Bacteroidales bacterium]|nr:LPS-assembly protein LptD [Bacteroidales bacterium]